MALVAPVLPPVVMRCVVWPTTLIRMLLMLASVAVTAPFASRYWNRSPPVLASGPSMGWGEASPALIDWAPSHLLPPFSYISSFIFSKVRTGVPMSGNAPSAAASVSVYAGVVPTPLGQVLVATPVILATAHASVDTWAPL